MGKGAVTMKKVMCAALSLIMVAVLFCLPVSAADDTSSLTVVTSTTDSSVESSDDVFSDSASVLNDFQVLAASSTDDLLSSILSYVSLISAQLQFLSDHFIGFREFSPVSDFTLSSKAFNNSSLVSSSASIASYSSYYRVTTSFASSNRVELTFSYKNGPVDLEPYTDYSLDFLGLDCSSSAWNVNGVQVVINPGRDNFTVDLDRGSSSDPYGYGKVSPCVFSSSDVSNSFYGFTLVLKYSTLVSSRLYNFTPFVLSRNDSVVSAITSQTNTLSSILLGVSSSIDNQTSSLSATLSSISSYISGQNVFLNDLVTAVGVLKDGLASLRTDVSGQNVLLNDLVTAIEGLKDGLVPSTSDPEELPFNKLFRKLDAIQGAIIGGAIFDGIASFLDAGTLLDFLDVGASGLLPLAKDLIPDVFGSITSLIGGGLLSLGAAIGLSQGYGAAINDIYHLFPPEIQTFIYVTIAVLLLLGSIKFFRRA